MSAFAAFSSLSHDRHTTGSIASVRCCCCRRSRSRRRRGGRIGMWLRLIWWPLLQLQADRARLQRLAAGSRPTKRGAGVGGARDCGVLWIRNEPLCVSTLDQQRTKHARITKHETTDDSRSSRGIRGFCRFIHHSSARRSGEKWGKRSVGGQRKPEHEQ